MDVRATPKINQISYGSLYLQLLYAPIFYPIPVLVFLDDSIDFQNIVQFAFIVTYLSLMFFMLLLFLLSYRYLWNILFLGGIDLSLLIKSVSTVAVSLWITLLLKLIAFSEYGCHILLVAISLQGLLWIQTYFYTFYYVSLF